MISKTSVNKFLSQLLFVYCRAWFGFGYVERKPSWGTHFFVHLGAPSTLVLWNAMKGATKGGSERSSQLEFIAHVGSLYNYNRVDIYILVYDYREGFQIGL